LGWIPAATRRRRNALLRRGLLRLLEPAEVGAAWAARELVELTAAGLRRVAAWQGLPLAAAVRWNGLAGGGPHEPRGPRRQLLAALAHTRGVDDFFLDVYQAARRADGDALVEWRNAAACARGRVRPDGY